MAIIGGNNLDTATGLDTQENTQRFYRDTFTSFLQNRNVAADRAAIDGTDQITTFSSNFTIDDGMLSVQALSLRTNNITIVFGSNGTINYEDGYYAFDRTGKNLIGLNNANNITFDGRPGFRWQCNDTTNYVGWGCAASGGTMNGAMLGQRFIRGNPSAAGWFINLEDSDATFNFSTQVLEGVLNTPTPGNILQLNNDGSTRHQGGYSTRYAIRVNGFNTSSRLWTALNGGEWDNNTNFPYVTVNTNGSTNAAVSPNVHVQFNTGTTSGTPIIFCWNNRIAHSVLTVSSQQHNDVTFLSGFTWAPIIQDDVNLTRVSDAVVLSLPANTRRLPSTVNLTSLPGLDTEGTNATDKSLNTSGYFIQVDSEEIDDSTVSVNRQAKVLNKAVNFDGSLSTAATTFLTAQGNPRIKSYTHQAGEVTPQLSDMIYSGGNAGTISYVDTDNNIDNRHQILYTADPNLNNLSAVDAADMETDLLTDIDDFYPVLKVDWFQDNNNLNEFPVSVVGTTLTATNGLSIRSTFTSTGIVASNQNAVVRTSTSPKTAGTINGFAVTGGQLNVRDINLPPGGFTLNGGSTPIILTDTRCQGPLTISGSAASGLGLGTGTNQQFNGITFDSTITQIVLEENSDVNITLSDAWGEVVVQGTRSGNGRLHIINNGTGDVTLNVPNSVFTQVRGDAGSQVFGAVTIDEIGVSDVTVTVPTSGLEAGVVWQVRRGDGSLRNHGVGPTTNDLTITETSADITSMSRLQQYYFGSVARNRQCRWNGVRVSPNTTVGPSTQDVTLSAETGAILLGVPSDNTFNGVVGFSSQLTSGTNLLQISMNLNPTNAAGILNIQGTTSRFADERIAVIGNTTEGLYLTLMYQQIDNDNVLFIPSNGTITHDALIPTARGVDCRDARCRFLGTLADNDVQVIPGAIVTNDSQDFNTVGLTDTQQIQPTNVERASPADGGEPQVILFPRFADRTLATVDTQRILNAFGPLY